MQTHSGTRCNTPSVRGCLLLLGLMLVPGCEGEDGSTQTLPDAMTSGPQPGLGLDAGQGSTGSDTGISGRSASDAASGADAASPASDAGADTGTRPIDASAPRDASVPRSDAQTPTSDASVCERWKAERVDLTEGTWGGSVDTCTAGETPAATATNALRVFNLYRSLVGLATFPADPAANKRAQDCALLMAANGTISHMPPSSWKCYTAEGAATAASSSLATGPSVSSVDAYVIDPGNLTTLGHRRWVFSTYLASIGFGSAGRFSCQYQPPRQGAGTGGAGKPWIAWPAPGQMPLQAIKQKRGSLDMTGWSIQSDSINLQAGQVSVMKAGSALPVTVMPLPAGYGSRYALSFTPQGWTTEAGATYEVSITGISTPINYSVEIVDCGS